MKQVRTLLLGLLITAITQAQSSNAIEASYFSKNSSKPLLISGKGFNINDLYKPTRSCFTSESTDSKNLVQRDASATTKLSIFYIRTNKEFTDYKSRGSSASISALSLFTVGSQNLVEYMTKNSLESERIIFKATVDFGTFSFNKEPVLTAEAKALITQNKLQDFVKMYGTHYIDGVRKGNSITVILKKVKETRTASSGTSYSEGISGSIPFKGSVSIGSQDRDWANRELRTSRFDISVEIVGPTIDQSTIQSDISSILSGNEQNKIDAISKIINGALNNLSDVNKASITQYYYSPFSLYGLDGIYWDDKKQKQLMKINEAAIQVYSAKFMLDELIAPGGKDQLAARYLNDKISDRNRQSFIETYNEILPNLRTLDQEAEKRLSELEERYTKCSDVFCPNNPDCCDNEAYITELTNYDFHSRVDMEMEKIKVLVKEINRPECEKLQIGTIRIINTSGNPYHIYKGDQFIETLAANKSANYPATMGIHNYKAVQQSGYVFYATKNIRTASITRPCQEVILKIGFED